MASLRLLFTCRPLEGHFRPLLPLALTARAAGHNVAFATGEPWVGVAREAGFDAMVAGTDESFRDTWAPRFPGYERLGGDEQRRFFFREIFGNLELAPRAADLDGIVSRWTPDVLVHEMAELAAPLIGSARGIPYVEVSFGPLIGLSILGAAAEGAAPHWRSRGVEPHGPAGLFRHLYIDTCPPSLQDPQIASIAAVQPLRSAAADPPEVDPPAWLDDLSGRAIVYVTLGTTWNRDLQVFRSVIEALRDQDLALIVTVGRQNDPAQLGRQPPNVVIHRFIPQSALLPRCDAVIAHGGAGTILGALAFGVPLLVLPQGADQFANGDRVAAAGAGRVLSTHQRSAAALREALLDVLHDPTYRQSAQRIHDEIWAMPDAAASLRRIESLV